MRGLLYVLAALGVMALGYWAYEENYETQAAIEEVAQLRAQVARAHARLDMLRDEWAYLNRPDRLMALQRAHFDTLGLFAMSPDSFGHFEQVAFPPQTRDLVLDGTVEVSSDGQLRVQNASPTMGTEVRP